MAPHSSTLAWKSHGWRSLVGCSPWGLEESGTTEWLHFHFSLSCTGEGNGNPPQCSCLENPRDGGAWWAAICGAAQSRTRLKWLSSSSSKGSKIDSDGGQEVTLRWKSLPEWRLGEGAPLGSGQLHVSKLEQWCFSNMSVLTGGRRHIRTGETVPMINLLFNFHRYEAYFKMFFTEDRAFYKGWSFNQPRVEQRELVPIKEQILRRLAPSSHASPHPQSHQQSTATHSVRNQLVALGRPSRVPVNPNTGHPVQCLSGRVPQVTGYRRETSNHGVLVKVQGKCSQPSCISWGKGIQRCKRHVSRTSQSFLQGIKTLLYHCWGEGNGTPLQYSCLENPMDRGAW